MKKNNKKEMCSCGCGETVENCACPPTSKCKTTGSCKK